LKLLLFLMVGREYAFPRTRASQRARIYGRFTVRLDLGIDWTNRVSLRLDFGEPHELSIIDFVRRMSRRAFNEAKLLRMF